MNKGNATGFAVETRSLSKRFGEVRANRDVTFAVKAGTVHGIVGENGAGKSTLMNLLFGFYQPDAGEILLGGKSVRFANPRQAIEAGLGMVHQHFTLVDDFTVLENVVLGFEGGMDLSKSLAKAREELLEIEKTYNLSVDPDSIAETLPVGVLQRVEILKALYRGADILILDEPTGVLTPQETEALFDVVRTLRGQGKTILLITHKLGEIMAVTDNVSVMRHGEMVASFMTSETNERELAEAMVGSSLTEPRAKENNLKGKPLLKVSGLVAKDDHDRKKLDGVSLEVNAGEIVGIVGVAGNGQTELMEVVTGMRSPISGSVQVQGKKLKHSADAPLRLRKRGLGHVAEDRHRFGMAGEMTAAENAILGYQDRATYRSRGLLSPDRIRAGCARMMEEFDVRPQSPDLALKSFSGGNQQKLVIARELEHGPELLVIGQPTRGVDIGATMAIHNRLIELRNQGKGILMISSELDEVLSLSDRLIVFCDGKITGEGRPETLSREQIGLMMAGAEGRV